MNSNVLVTGGAGYVGSHACKALATAGYTPITIDDLSTGHRWAVKWGPLIEGDIANYKLVMDTLTRYEIHAVLHFAAHAYVGESIVNPRKYFRTNVSKTLALLEAVLDARIDIFIFSSSCATYGISAEPIAEDHLQNPINPYGASKLFIENVLKWYENAYGMRYVILRYFNVAGADPDGEIGEVHTPETHIVPLVIAAARGNGPPIEIFGTDYDTADGTAVRDFIHVSDLASAHVKAIDRLFAGNPSVSCNLGTGQGYSIREIIAVVEQVAGKKISAVEGIRRPGDPPALIANPEFGQVTFDWYPAHSDLETIVRTAYAWHQKADNLQKNS
jgi:UDP-arabinose 4-epimerase